MIAGLLLTGLAASASAVTYYVDSKFQGESPTGLSWLSAFPDLNMALEAASTNAASQIWVRAGVYHPGGSGRTTTFTLPEGTQLYGGFRGGETNLVERNPKAYTTRLSGDVGRAGSISDNSYHVLTAAGNTVIDGFTVQRGNANSISENRFGGGLRMLPGSKNVTVANCTFEKNNAESGGAIHLSDGELSISNCTFYSNSADTGGAVATLGRSTLRIEDSIFTSNFAPQQGGALKFNQGAQATISTASFLYNSTDDFGGAIAADTRAPSAISLVVTDCRFSENSARNSGGALGLAGPFQPEFTNCIFEKNFSARGAGAVAARDGTTVLLLESTFGRNRGSKGMENIGHDENAAVVESREEAEQLLAKIRAEQKEAEPEPEPEPEPEAVTVFLPDVYVYTARDQSKVKLRSMVSRAPHTVLVFGDLTDDAFIKNYRTIEAAARDFYPKGVRFFYIYRHLKHPENNGFVKPFSIRERVQHTVVARDLLSTMIPWLCDTMDNDAAEKLMIPGAGPVFIFSASGE